MKPKLLFFLMNGVGGAERMTITIANFFDREQYDVRYVLVQQGDDAICQFMRKDDAIIRIPCKRIYLSTCPIYRLLRRERPQVVFCASPAINARLIVAARLVGIIRVVVRNSNMFSFERRDVQWLMKRTYKWADCIILQQDEMREDLHRRIPRLPREKTITLNNPIDVVHINEGITAPNPYPKDAKAVNYLWVARFAQEKAQDVLVHAFAIVRQQQPEAQLWLVGRYNPDSEYVRKVLSVISEKGLGESVHLVGHDSNPYRWMQHCDCFVLPSRFEGLPNALVEAMYLGRPVVAARCLDIIKEMVSEGQNGYTCEVGNAEELADKMLLAVRLKDCKMTYQPARKEDFINVITGNDK